jgi:putative membrane protein
MPPAPPPAIGVAPATAPSPQEFAQTVAASDAFEIQASQLAAQKATRADVKEFARTMVNDHQTRARELTRLAPRMELTAPTPELTAEQRSNLDALRTATGAAFDEAYLDQQVAAHRAAVSAFETFANNATDSELRQWASATLPKLQQHLSRAEALRSAT